MVLKVTAVVLIAAGFGIVAEAKRIVEKFNLDKKVAINDENMMEPEEAEDYRRVKATAGVKLCGMLVALPGLALLLIALNNFK